MRIRLFLPTLLLILLAGSDHSLDAVQLPVHELSLASQFRVSGSYLGIRLQDIDEDRAKVLKLGDLRGVEVMAVESGSPAENAGLKPGDVLLTYNSEDIVGGQQLGRLVEETPPGRRIKIEYWREGKTRNVIVTTATPPHHLTNMPTNFVGFDVPQPLRGFQIPEIPTPFLVWRSPMFGVECEGIESQLAHYFGVNRGILVRSVVKDSIAEKAGLRAGDVLTKLGDRTLALPRDFTSYLRMPHPGAKTASLELIRDHKNLTISIPLPDVPER